MLLKIKVKAARDFLHDSSACFFTFCWVKYFPFPLDFDDGEIETEPS